MPSGLPELQSVDCAQVPTPKFEYTRPATWPNTRSSGLSRSTPKTALGADRRDRGVGQLPGGVNHHLSLTRCRGSRGQTARATTDAVTGATQSQTLQAMTPTAEVDYGRGPRTLGGDPRKNNQTPTTIRRRVPVCCTPTVPRRTSYPTTFSATRCRWSTENGDRYAYAYTARRNPFPRVLRLSKQSPAAAFTLFLILTLLLPSFFHHRLYFPHLFCF